MLAQSLGSKDLALVVLVRLWVFLAYEARKEDLGVILPDRFDGFIYDLKESCGDGLAQHYVDLREKLIGCGLLVEREGRLVCEQFRAANEQWARGYKSIQQRGAEARRFNQRLEREEAGLVSGALFLDPKWLVWKGQTMDAAMVRRVMWLIRAVDNALRCPERRSHEFSERLIQDAAAAVDGTEEMTLMAGVRKVLEKRGHAAMPQATEQVLARWGKIVKGK